MKTLKKYLTGIVLAMLFACIFVGTRAEAAEPGKVMGVKQTGSTTYSINVEWDAQLAEKVRYEVEISEDKVTWYPKGDFGYAYTNLYNLNAGKTYYVRVRASVQEKYDSPVEYGVYSDVLECVTEPNEKPEYLRKTSSTTTSMTLSWGAVNGANAYGVKYYPTKIGVKAAKSKLVTTNGIKLTGLKKDTQYTVYVYGVRQTSDKTFSTNKESGSSYTYEWNLGVTPGKITGVECDYYWQNLKDISVVYKLRDSADGYQVEVWTANKRKDTKLASAQGNSYGADIKKSVFGKHNMIKIRVRGYAAAYNGAKKYGAWSSWTYVCPQPTVTNMKATSKGMNVTWDKISGADRYVVYASEKEKSGYKKVATVTKTSYTLTKWNKKALKNNKNYYFYVDAQKKVGKKYYSGEAGNSNMCWYKPYKK